MLVIWKGILLGGTWRLEGVIIGISGRIVGRILVLFLGQGESGGG